jgi:hypothetical protein
MSYVVLMLCGHCFRDNIMETKDEPNVFLYCIAMHGFNGTSPALEKGKN